MAELQYLDFDLRIEPSEAGYRAEVLACPAGQARAEFDVPFSDLEIENLILRLGRPRQGVRRVDSPEMEAAKDFGARLFEAVFDGEVRACLRSSLDEAARQGAGLRVRLHLAEAPELANWPWEYFYNPALNRFLSLSVETPLVRYLDLPERIRPLAIHPPLRVLVMISSPNDYDALDVEGEWSKLQEALGDLQQRGLVTLERLEEATLAALQKRLRQGEVHILHFIGHGGFSERREDGVLILEDEQGRGRRVSGQDLGMLLHDHRSLRLAILNACEGARTSCNDPFAGTAQSLIQQGIPAVIGMQFPVTDSAAITLAHEFYGALADGYPVDASLAEARKAIFAQGHDTEWGTPVLYMRSPDGVLFNVQERKVQPLPPPLPVPRPQRAPIGQTERKRRKLPVAVWVVLALIVLAGGGLVLGKAIGWLPEPTFTAIPQAALPSLATPTLTTTATPAPTDTTPATPVPPTGTPPPTVTPAPPTRTPSSNATPISPTNTLQPATPAATPTSAPPKPTTAPASTPSSGVLLSFEQWGTWTRGEQPYGELAQTEEQVHSGRYAAKLTYDFPETDQDFIVYRQATAIDGEPNALSLWVYGDGSGHFLNVWIEDAKQQVWSVHLGRIGPAGWQQMTGRIDPGRPWPSGHVFGPQDAAIDYPIRFYGLVLDRPAAGPTKGTIYLDELSVGQGEAPAPDESLASVAPTPGTNGRIVFTIQVGEQYSLYATDPTWETMAKLGDTDWTHSTCAEESAATTLEGLTVQLRPPERCSIAGTVDSCPSPNGQFKVNTSRSGSDYQVTLWRTSDNKMLEATYIGPLNIHPGINWSPDSSHFLFTVEQSVYRADIGQAGYRMVLSLKHDTWPLQYTPDGAFVYYLKPVSETISDVFLARPDGTDEHNLTNSPDTVKLCPRWRQ